MTKRLDDITARVEAATPGPWEHDVDCYDMEERRIEPGVYSLDAGVPSMLFTSETDFYDRGGERDRAEQWRLAKESQAYRDAAFLAAARADVPYLLAIARAAERMVMVSDCMCGTIYREKCSWCDLRAALESKEDVR